MLKHLIIKNIILIESQELQFEKGLNVLSGETGSGKSAIMNALNLLAGERSDVGMIRRGSDKGSVEAIFDIDNIPSIRHILAEAGIEHEPDEDLIIRRETNQSGKSRAFINNQSAQIALLRKLSEHLFSIVGQHANRWLLSVEKHRDTLDLYGGMNPEVTAFNKSWIEENGVRKELEQLKSSESQRLRDIEVCRMELEELDEANLKEGEDEELFSEYTLLSNSEERAQKALEICQTLNGERLSVLALLSRQKSNCDQLALIDPSLEEAAKSFSNALLELQEVSYTLRNYHSKIEYNPSRISEVNDRLALITKLKRKYGDTLEEIQRYRQSLIEKLELLENADSQIEALEEKLKLLEKETNELAGLLTAKRTKAAKQFEKAVVSQLRSLNMPKVEFLVEITKQKRCGKGDDLVEYFLIPNVGEHKIAIRECASGGELSRLMLSIQALLAGKEQTPTLIFDEIDANIGGETAAIVGEKLKEIGIKHQVLCITHFPQVASQALNHFRISKTEEQGRTFSIVTKLNGEEREEELARMLGGKFEYSK